MEELLMVGRRKKGDGFEEKEQVGSREGVVRGLSLCLVPKKVWILVL